MVRDQGTGWLSFAAGFIPTLAVYIASLPPEVGLGMDGIYTAAAGYAGVPHPTGNALWSFYAWTATKLLPFGTIAWRVAFSSAFAAAISAGLVAWMVSRGGQLMLAGLAPEKRLAARDERWISVVAGGVAGAALAFSNSVWRQAVSPRPDSFGLVLFCLTLAVLLSWHLDPARPWRLLAAAFIYGLCLSNSPHFFAAAPALLAWIVLARPDLGRDFSATITLLLVVLVVGNYNYWWPELVVRVAHIYGLWDFYLLAAFFTGLVATILINSTRRFFSTAPVVLGLLLALLAGKAFIFLTPISAMTNPPVNWGYARTPEGFVHLVGRGQYEDITPTLNPVTIVRALFDIAPALLESFSWLFWLPAGLGLFYGFRAGGTLRRWMPGSVGLFACLTVLLLAGINPPPRPAVGMLLPYLAGAHVVLALWAGLGLIAAGTVLVRSRDPAAAAPGRSVDTRPPAAQM